jgi:hypothetical protein
VRQLRYNLDMPRVFLGNYDFEHELARYQADASPAIPAAAARVRKAFGGPAGSDLSWSWISVAAADDVVIAPGHIDGRDFNPLSDLGLPIPRFVSECGVLDELPDATLVPWGWSASAVALGSLYGWDCPAPPIGVVRKMNTREFRFELEHDWRVGLPGAALVNSLDELPDLLQVRRGAETGWLLKANFGMSGREAVRGRGTSLDEKTRNWAARRLARGGPIVFEPFVERVAESGIQIEITRDQAPHLAGVTPLLVDRSGTYRGSRFGCPAREIEAWQPAVETGLRAARLLQHAGYFGPLGIDAMQYRDEKGRLHMRPLQDVNARYTMGRLALGFARILPPGWCGTWIHFGSRHLAGRSVADLVASLGSEQPAAVRLIPASPHRIGAQPSAHHAVLILAPTPESRQKTEAILFESLGISVNPPAA